MSDVAVVGSEALRVSDCWQVESIDPSFAQFAFEGGGHAVQQDDGLLARMMAGPEVEYGDYSEHKAVCAGLNLIREANAQLDDAVSRAAFEHASVRLLDAWHRKFTGQLARAARCIESEQGQAAVLLHEPADRHGRHIVARLSGLQAQLDEERVHGTPRILIEGKSKRTGTIPHGFSRLSGLYIMNKGDR